MDPKPDAPPAWTLSEDGTSWRHCEISGRRGIVSLTKNVTGGLTATAIVEVVSSSGFGSAKDAMQYVDSWLGDMPGPKSSAMAIELKNKAASPSKSKRKL